MDTQHKPAAGWYDDGNGRVRWWDGAAWTDHVPPQPAAPAPPAAQPTGYQPTPAGYGADPRFGTAPAGGGTTTATLPAPPPVGATDVTPAGGRRAASAASAGPRQASPRAEGLGMLLLGLFFIAPALGGVFLWEGTGMLRVLPWVAAAMGLFVAGNGVAALVTGQRAPAMSWVSNSPDRAARGDKRLLVLLGIVLLLVLGSIALARSGSSASDPAPTPTTAAAAATPKADLPKGFKPVADTGGYKVLAPSAATCAAGTSCRALSLVSRTTCRTLTALVLFANASGQRVGSDVVVAAKVKPGKPVKVRAAITEAGGRDVRVSTLVCAT